jgi:hypothetical protein
MAHPILNEIDAFLRHARHGREHFRPLALGDWKFVKELRGDGRDSPAACGPRPNRRSVISWRPIGRGAAGRSGVIYFATCREIGRVKIGRANNVKRRLGELRVSCPLDLTLEAVTDGDEAEEIALHDRFAKDRTRIAWKPTPHLSSPALR